MTRNRFIHCLWLALSITSFITALIAIQPLSCRDGWVWIVFGLPCCLMPVFGLAFVRIGCTHPTMGYGKGARQAYDIRDLTAAEAIALLQPDPPDQPPLGFQDRLKRAMAVTSLVKAWEAASDRIRIARGQPLPGSRRPSAKPTRQPRRQSGLAQPASGLAAQPKPPEPKVGPDQPA